jgi:hypothetical protein
MSLLLQFRNACYNSVHLDIRDTASNSFSLGLTFIESLFYTLDTANNINRIMLHFDNKTTTHSRLRL